MGGGNDERCERFSLVFQSYRPVHLTLGEFWGGRQVRERIDEVRVVALVNVAGLLDWAIAV